MFLNLDDEDDLRENIKELCHVVVVDLVPVGQGRVLNSS